MPHFTLVFNDDSQQIISAPTKNSMIREFSKEDCTSFQENVKEIHWQEANIHFTEIVYTGVIIQKII
ncbi:hypothetical protein GCM10011506_40740 [Marivirga lumbricoides]|uniref:DUF2442 domain-containing protein n=1 Tax=Marivirga lumbricoides TaxID=1046115 RepID=A0ABQ1N0X0_9BACT|nr:hypothetical protein GCM10011506_40740 [Marivirga lumbricoides]